MRAGGHDLEVARLDGTRPGPTLVLLHEGLGSVSLWKTFPERLASMTGLPLLAYSRWGYGKSEAVTLPRPLSFMHDEARVLPELLDAAGIEEAILVGHSDGASIALLHAATGSPRIKGVVAMAPHVFVEEKCVVEIARLARELPGSDLERRLGRHHADVAGAFQGWAGAWLDPAFLAWDLTSLLPGVNAPVLVIQGDQDAYGTLAQVDAVCSGVSGPSDRLVLAGAGHSPHREREAETASAIAEWISARTARREGW